MTLEVPSLVTPLEVTIEGTPQPQGSKRLVKGNIIESNAERLRPWRDIITYRVSRAIPSEWSTSETYRVLLDFYFPRPKSHLRANGEVKPNAEIRKSTKPDIDKLSRAVLDACTDANVWRDDAQVSTLYARKWYGKPGLEILIYMSDGRV